MPLILKLRYGLFGLSGAADAGGQTTNAAAATKVKSPIFRSMMRSLGETRADKVDYMPPWTLRQNYGNKARRNNALGSLLRLGILRQLTNQRWTTAVRLPAPSNRNCISLPIRHPTGSRCRTACT